MDTSLNQHERVRLHGLNNAMDGRVGVATTFDGKLWTVKLEPRGTVYVAVCNLQKVAATGSSKAPRAIFSLVAFFSALPQELVVGCLLKLPRSHLLKVRQLSKLFGEYFIHAVAQHPQCTMLSLFLSGHRDGASLGIYTWGARKQPLPFDFFDHNTKVGLFDHGERRLTRNTLLAVGRAFAPGLHYLDLTLGDRYTLDVAQRFVEYTSERLLALSISGRALRSDSLLNICRCLPQLSGLQVRIWEGPWQPSVAAQAIALLCPRLQTVDLGDDSGMEEWASNFPCLQKLKLRRGHVDVGAVLPIFESCPRVTDLDLSSVLLPDRKLEELTAPISGQLERLNLALADVPAASLIACVERCACLQDLDLRTFCFQPRTTVLAASTMIAVVHACPQLKIIAIDGEVNDDVVIAIASTCTQLERLDFGHCGEGLTDAAMDYLAVSPCVRSLRQFRSSGFAGGVTGLGILRMVKRCPVLIELQWDCWEGNCAPTPEQEARGSVHDGQRIPYHQYIDYPQVVLDIRAALKDRGGVATFWEQ